MQLLSPLRSGIEKKHLEERDKDHGTNEGILVPSFIKNKIFLFFVFFFVVGFLSKLSEEIPAWLAPRAVVSSTCIRSWNCRVCPLESVLLPVFKVSEYGFGLLQWLVQVTLWSEVFPL